MNDKEKIAAVLSTADQEITALKYKLHALKRKKALMQELLTGKRRVNVN